MIKIIDREKLRSMMKIRTSNTLLRVRMINISLKNNKRIDRIFWINKMKWCKKLVKMLMVLNKYNTLYFIHLLKIN